MRRIVAIALLLIAVPLVLVFGIAAGGGGSSGGFGELAGLGCVGSHSMKRSPISDCGRIVQKASLRKSW